MEAFFLAICSKRVLGSIIFLPAAVFYEAIKLIQVIFNFGFKFFLLSKVVKPSDKDFKTCINKPLPLYVLTAHQGHFLPKLASRLLQDSNALGQGILSCGEDD